ncbi:MAG: NAD-dependent DNA ligase LigA [Flavobacteriales bacterium]|nr:NAD-dependent DNA ligase LigA [Flavobacteriales bacterium]
MDKTAAKKTIEKLSEELRQHNHNYYVLNKPTISDYDFDMMLQELQSLEEQFPEFADDHSPTKRVGGDITKNFPKVKHVYPMLSLDNSYSIEEIKDFETRAQKMVDGELDYTCELKYDGVAIGITYEKGNLVSAVTRGNGQEGEQVTANVKTIRSIPMKLNGDFPAKFEIRGEIVLPRPQFDKLNEIRAKEGLEAYMNPRNTASGSLKLQDSSEVAKRGLDAYLYGLYGEELPHEDHYSRVVEAGKWGFKIPSVQDRYIQRCKNIEEILEFIDYWDKQRTNLEFDIDGIVIKVNSYQHQKQLGYTSKSPRWAIAFKFKSESVRTRLNAVTYQVGRTGAITPVANLEPVLLGGTTVKRASLHNADQIEKLDVRVGDQVFVEKGGEIIPKITSVDLEFRDTDLVPLKYASHCPECSTELIRKEGEAQHFCPNDMACPPQVKGRIEHFIGRKAMNIDGMGVETIDQLVSEGLINNYAGLYSLRSEQLLPLERMAEKTVTNLLEGLEASKKVPFERVLFAMGIRYVGETVAKKLARHFKNIDALMSASFEELIAIDEIGDRIAESVIEFFGQEQNRALVEELKGKGLQFELDDGQLEGMSQKLAGSTFVVSGVFQQFSRDEIKAEIEKNGGKLSGSISGKTSYVVAGDNMGPSKKAKADKLGVPILSEQELIDMIA